MNEDKLDESEEYMEINYKQIKRMIKKITWG